MAFTASNGRTQTALADINITPLVDVVLVLLIIFMVTAPVLQSGIDVSVPKTKYVKEITQERLVITITRISGSFWGTIRSTSTKSEASCGRRFEIRGISRSLCGRTRMFRLVRSLPSWTRSNRPALPTSAS